MQLSVFQMARRVNRAPAFRVFSRRSRVGAFLAAMVALAAPLTLSAQDPVQPGVQIGLNYALGTKPGVLVLPADMAGGDSIRAIIQRDLDYDDRATVVALGTSEARGLLPKAGGNFNFALLEKLGVVALIHPRATLAGITVTMYDVAAKKAIKTETFATPSDPNSPSWRMALHGISDQIGMWIFGSRGAAQSRVLYTLSGQVWIIDSDGANPRQLTKVSGLAMSPAWHPSGTKMAFSTSNNRGWQIAMHSFETGETHMKSSSDRGLNTTPAFSPDGKTMAYSNGVEVGTNIVIANVTSNSPARRITVGRGSDNTSPSFSPNGQRIVFMSGRAGFPEIYLMDVDGTNVQRLTESNYGERNWRASPDWAPDGRMVAYQSRIGGLFQIMTIDMRDRSTKQYTSDGENEDPSWAADGRHLVFSSTRSGIRQLWVADVETGRLRQLTRQGGAKLPSWSPTLKR